MARFVLGLLLAGGLCLLLADPPVASAQKGGNNGTVKLVDPKTGTITFNMLVPVTGSKKKMEMGEKQFLLADDAKVTITSGGQSKTMTGKEALEAGVIKDGASATFVPEGNLKLKELTIGGGKK